MDRDVLRQWMKINKPTVREVRDALAVARSSYMTHAEETRFVSTLFLIQLGET